MATVFRKFYPLFFGLAILWLCFPVYADDTVNFPDFPQQLSEATAIPLFASQVLCSVIFLMMFLLPLNALKMRHGGVGLIPNMMVGLGVLGFCVAIGWFPVWLLLIIVLIIATMWSSKISGWIGGHVGGS